MPEVPPISPTSTTEKPAAPTATNDPAAPVTEPSKTYAGKYTSVEDLEKGYVELEKKLGQAKPSPSGKSAGIAPIEAPKADDDFDTSTLIDRAGLDPEEVVQSWKDNGGKLTDEQYAALRKVNPALGRKMVNDYMRVMADNAELQQIRVDRAVTEAESVAGGKTQLETLRQWYAANGDASQRDRLNGMLKGNPSFYPDYVRIIAQAHAAAVQSGGARPLIGGGSTAAQGGIPATAKEFSELTSAAARGDAGAIARLKNMPEEQFAASMSKLMNT